MADLTAANARQSHDAHQSRSPLPLVVLELERVGDRVVARTRMTNGGIGLLDLGEHDPADDVWRALDAASRRALTCAYAQHLEKLQTQRARPRAAKDGAT